jgi:O-6-methylguanine DNA methyltransferase
MYYDEWVTPLGRVLAVATDTGLAQFCLSDAKRSLESARNHQRSPEKLAEVKRQFAEYCAGKRQEFDLFLDMRGTDFQLRVWRALQRVPYGKTASYLDIAKAIDNPKAVRAVGAANGKNPVWVIVPCHRVIGKDGSLTGYGGGLPLKQRLLRLEQADDAA